MSAQESSAQTGRERRKPDLFQRILTLEEEINKEPQKAVKPLAEAYMLAGRPQAAIRLIQKHLGKEKENKELQVVLAEAYFDCFETSKTIGILQSLGDFSEQSARAQRLLGEIALDEDKPDIAKEHLQKAIKLNGVNRQAANLLIGLGVDVDSKHTKEVEEDFTTPLVTGHYDREPPGRAILHVLLAALMFGGFFVLYRWQVSIAYEAASLVMEARPSVEGGDVNAVRYSIETYEKVLDIDSDNAHAISGLAEAHALLWYEHGFQQEKEPALKYLKMAQEEGIEKAERYLAEGLSYLQEDKYEQAVALAKSLYKRGAVDERVSFIYGMALLHAGEIENARNELKKAADVNVKMPLYTVALGDVYYIQGDDRNPNFYWTRVERSNPAHIIGASRGIVAKTKMGKELQVLENQIKRLDNYPQEVKGSKDEAAIFWAKSEVFLREGDFEQAEQMINKGLEILADDPIMLSVKGRILNAAGKIDQGIESFKKAVALIPKSKRFVYELADAYKQNKLFDDALVTLKTMDEELQSDPEYYIKLGDIYLARSDMENAKSMYDKAVTINESYAPNYYALGYFYQMQKQHQEAANYYQKAAELREKYPAVYRQMGVMFTELGDLEGAHGWFDDAEKMLLLKHAITKREMRAFYQTAINAFIAKGRAASKYAGIWQKKLDDYKRL